MNIRNINIECITADNKNKPYVYGIRNMITNKYYIGSTINKLGVYIRIARHIYNLRTNSHHSEKLQRSFNKYECDFSKWEFILFEEITKNNSQIREQYYIDKYESYNNGYNSTPLAGIVNSGKMRDSHKKAISDSKQNLTDLNIISIFDKYNNGLNYREISKYYNLSSPTISTIINNDKYYADVKIKYSLCKKWYNYIFYNLTDNKFHRVINFTEFCKSHKLNAKMMMPLYLRTLKMTFLNGWTAFNKQNFSLSELRNRIEIDHGKEYILYRDNLQYTFASVKLFCKDHKLDETSIYHVLNGTKSSSKGFSL